MQITLKNLQKKFPIPQAKILKTVKGVFRKLKFKSGELSIVFSGSKRMRAINKKYLNHDFVTDVLTFDLGGDVSEIIICPEIAGINAKKYKTSTEEEIILYVVHGILHLAGFDDHSEKNRTQMRLMEKKLMKKS